MEDRQVLRASVGEVGADAEGGESSAPAGNEWEVGAGVDGGESSAPAGSVRGDRGGAKPPTDLTHLLLGW